MKCFLAVSLAAMTLVATGQAASAGNADHGYVRQTGRVEPHARYSNDVAYEFGTVSRRGTKTVPYVERCYWTVNPGSILFRGLKQVCTRYTLDNTE
jgi:hypothetical protein